MNQNRFMELFEEITREYAEEGFFAGGFGELREFLCLLGTKLNSDEAKELVDCLMSEDELKEIAYEMIEQE